MTVYVGIDLSLKSTGLAIYDGDTWILCGFAQRVRESNLVVQKDGVNIRILPGIPPPPASNEARYEHVRRHLMDILSMYATCTDVVVGIEGYAFNASASGSAYKLQELGGIIKHTIHVTYPTWEMVVVPPGKWKRQTIGNGHATKADAVRHISHHGPCVSILQELGLRGGTTDEVPCPAQDIADATCIAMSLYTPTPPPAPRKRKRRTLLIN